MTAPTELPDADLLNSLLRYDSKTGLLYWNARRCGTKFGAVAGNRNKKGYVRVKVNGALYLAHRLIWKMVTMEDPGEMEIDHIDGNAANNRIENLRKATHGQNQVNSGAHKSSASGYRGVHWHKQHRKYIAVISHEKRKYHIGLFNSAEEAAAAYDKKAQSLFGQFAKTNLDARNGKKWIV